LHTEGERTKKKENHRHLKGGSHTIEGTKVKPGNLRAKEERKGIELRQPPP